MSVSATAALDAESFGLYVPFRGVNRAYGPIGTLSWRKSVTGDAGGGSVQILATATREMFGFHPLLTVRGVNTDDDQAAATDVRIGFESTGNERLVTAWQTVDRKNARVGTVNVNIFSIDNYQLLIEPSEESAANVLTFNWETNTDTKVYNARAFFIVYDLQAISRGGSFVPDGAFINVG